MAQPCGGALAYSAAMDGTPFARQWSLGSRLLLVGAPFLALAVVVVTFTLWVSWQLDGGAAAVNEAGRLRMQAWRLAGSIAAGDAGAVRMQSQQFQHSLELLRVGDPDRRLLVPWDAAARARFARLEAEWSAFSTRWLQPTAPAGASLHDDTAAFVASVDAFVAAIESHLSRWTALLHLCQVGMLLLALAGAVALAYAVYRFVLAPLISLKSGILRLQRGDLGVRLPRLTPDEFGTLAEGFNQMAAHLQSMYRHLESRVAEKTAQLVEERERLESLYEVSKLVSIATSREQLTQGFARCVRRIARADAAALRWSHADRQRYLMLASDGLPEEIVQSEHCIHAGACHCGSGPGEAPLRVIPVVSGESPHPQCARAGFATLVSIPVRVHERTVGEVDLLFSRDVKLSEPERSMLQTVASHLGGALENLRLNSLETEAAVAHERGLLACELHDSIAQSLAFLMIQVRLMRDALASDDAQRLRQVLGEIDAGVRESYGDVRELLLHFRTRADAEDIELALRTTCAKFEHQCGIKVRLSLHGQGLPPTPDLQIQVLHILQEALSNVRKHARARHVWLDVQRQPHWRFEVRDDGIGFQADDPRRGETHVGLRIMAERAERIGATLELISTPGHGSSVVLELLPAAAASAAAAPQAEATPA